ncbi:MAG: mechanosensitive ion channel family protein [Deltaproteobacteria bacterium]|nr:mechanosensitive ion channel family protein [Deltaproteobacteria bacterium]
MPETPSAPSAVVEQGVQTIQTGVNWAHTALTLAWPMVSGLVFGALILVAGWVLSKWSRGAVLGVGRRAKMDEALLRFLASLLQYTVLTVAIIAGLGRLGVETASLVTILASAGLAVGLALQGSLSNFASGVMILFFRPFDLHDYITVDGITGEVVDMGLFNTILVTRDQRRIIVPNTHITGSVVANHTATGKRRLVLDVGVAYGSDIHQVQALLLEAASSTPLILTSPPVEISFVGLGASSLDFQVFGFCEPPTYPQASHELRSAIYLIFEREGVEIPFQQVVVHQAPPPAPPKGL